MFPYFSVSYFQFFCFLFLILALPLLLDPRARLVRWCGRGSIVWSPWFQCHRAKFRAPGFDSQWLPALFTFLSQPYYNYRIQIYFTLSQSITAPLHATKNTTTPIINNENHSLEHLVDAEFAIIGKRSCYIDCSSRSRKLQRTCIQLLPPRLKLVNNESLR